MPALAQHSADRAALDAVLDDINNTHNKQALTAAKIRRIEGDILTKQQDILARATTIRTKERDMLALQDHIDKLQQEEARRKRDMEDYRDHMSRLVSAAWSMQYRPQLAAWLLPEDTRKRALSARGLHMTTHSLKRAMEDLDTTLHELELLRADIITRQQNAHDAQQTLTKERAALQRDVASNQELRARLRKDNSTHQRRIADLTAKARTLEGLIGDLEINRASRVPDMSPDRAPISTAYHSSREFDTQAQSAFIAAKGRLALPAEGSITGRYGEKRSGKSTLKGIELHTARNAIVATPYQGEVLFTGPFMDYGNMVILRHSREYHTLVAGLSRIDVTTGQFLLDGEPIGAMGYNTNERNLYLELRKSSTAIDPKPWFAIQKNTYATR